MDAPGAGATHEPTTALPDTLPAAPTLAALFLTFLKIGTFSLGGVYSMLSFFERELVRRRAWLTADELAEVVALGQAMPGPPIINTSLLIGYRLRGLRGGLLGLLGLSLTGTVLAIILAGVYTRLRGNPHLAAVLRGMSAAVVGLLLSVVLSLGRQQVRHWRSAAFAVAAFVALAVFKLNPVLVVLLGAGGGLLLCRRRG
jgi:chromate transporter